MNPLDKLEKIVAHAEDDFVQIKDFADVFELLTSLISDIKKALEAKMSDDKSEMKEDMKEAHESLMEMDSKMKAMMASCEKMSLKHVKEMKDSLMSEIRMLENMMPTMPDLSMIEKKLEEMGKMKHMTMEEVREEIAQKNETLESKLLALEEELKTVKANSSRGGGVSVFGGRQLRMTPFSFTGNASDTVFYLPKEPGAKGLAIWAYYQGQHLQLGTQFSVSGKAFTCLGWTPEADTTIDGFIII